jgi:hypothetical protein
LTARIGIGRRTPEDPQFTRVRLDPTHDRAHERGLAGAIGAQKPQDLSGLDGKRHTSQGAVAPEGLHEISDFERKRLGHEGIIRRTPDLPVGAARFF